MNRQVLPSVEQITEVGLSGLYQHVIDVGARKEEAATIAQQTAAIWRHLNEI